MTAIQKMVEWLEKYKGHKGVIAGILFEAHRLAAEEAKEKPTAPASLVEEIEKELHNCFTAIVAQGRPSGDLAYELGSRIKTILSRYRPSSQTDVARNNTIELGSCKIVYSEADKDYLLMPLGKDRFDLDKVNGKVGKLIFAEYNN